MIDLDPVAWEVSDDPYILIYVLRDQVFGLDHFMVNCFEDSNHTFPFNIENTA